MSHVNELALRYIETRDETVFNDLYRELERKSWSRTRRKDAAYANTDENEIQSEYHMALLKAIDVFDGKKGEFEKLLNSITRNHIKDLARKNRRRYWLEMYADERGEEMGATITLQVVDERVDVEEAATSDIRKREQRQLLSFLVAAATDDLTVRIVDLYDQYPSENALGKALGISHVKVKRKITGLARFYDPARFGSIRDYLAV